MNDLISVDLISVDLMRGTHWSGQICPMHKKLVNDPVRIKISIQAMNVLAMHKHNRSKRE